MPRDDKATPPVDTDGEEVTIECWENHRYSPFSGWGPTTNGLDRPAWSTKKGDAVMCRESFLLPVGWSWVGSWNVEPHKENMEGWYYGPDFSISTKYCSSKPSRLSMVRRRRWVRTRRNCQAELEIVASVRSMIPRASSLLSSSLSSSIASAWMNIPEPKVFVPEFCFRYSTWTTTACYGFAGATERALASEQSRCHNSFIRLQSLLASTEFFDKQTHHTANQQQQQLGATSPPLDTENNSAATPQRNNNSNFQPRPGTATGTFVRSPFSASSEGLDVLAVARGEVDAASNDGDRAASPFSPFASPSDNSKGKGNDRTESSPGGFASPLIRGLRSRGGTFATGGASNGTSSNSAATSMKIETRVPEKVLHTVYKYGVAPVLRRHLWVAWSGAGAKKAANAGLFQRLAKEATGIMEKGHTEGTNEMLAEILQDVVRTAPRHPFFEHSQVLSLMKTKKTLALSSGSSPSSPTSPSSFSPPKRKGVGLEKEAAVTDNAQEGDPTSKDSSSSSPSPPASPLSTPTSITAEGSPVDQRKAAASLSNNQHAQQQRLPRPVATTTLSGAIATNTIASHAGGFVDDNSGSYRLALVLVCLALYEKEQADYKRSIDEALRLAGGAILGDASTFSTSNEVSDPEKWSNKRGTSTNPQQQQQQQQLLYKKVPEYHQAFSYMAALLLLNMGEEEAFWTLVCVLEDFLPIGYHDAFQMNTDLRILSEVVRERLPQLEANFSRHQVDMSVFASGWLQGLFCAHFPFATAARILDVMFAEGNSSILIRTIFAFIKLHKGTFLAEDSSCGAGQFANNWARECFDFDDVIAIVAAEQKGSSDFMSVIESRRRELYSHGGGHRCH